jgi:hypothetical protein
MAVWGQSYSIATPTILLKNLVTNGTTRLLPGSVDHPHFPAKNLLDEARSRPWRGQVVTGVPDPQVGFDFGTPMPIDTLAVVGYRSLTEQGEPITNGFEFLLFRAWLQAASDAAFTTDFWEVDFDVYNPLVDTGLVEIWRRQMPAAAVYVLYINTVALDDSTPLPPRRYARVKFQTEGSYAEVGAIFLGTRTPLALDSRLRMTSETMSDDAVLTTGRRFFDRRRRARAYQFSSPIVKSADVQTLRAQLEACEGRAVVVDPYAFAYNEARHESGVPHRSGAVIYGYLDGRIQWEERLYRAASAYGRLTFSVEEAIG